MKGLNMLIWVTQLGVSAALPPGCFTLLGIWLHRGRGWGSWTVWAGLVLGLVCSVRSFRDSLRAMEKMAGTVRQEPSPAAFDEHN